MKPTQKQKEIIELMRSGYRLMTTEGAKYKCWLERGSINKEKVKVSTATCESMYRKGLISPNCNSGPIFFEWKLA